MSQDRIEASDPIIPQSPGIEGIERARTRLASFIERTPLFRSAALSRAFQAEVWLKIETVSPIASFKLRGALNALLCVRERCGTIRSAVTSSTGNHGQGVALAAAWLGIPAEIFVPEESGAVKRAMIRLFGATLHIGGHDLDDAKERARAHARATGGIFVDDGEEAAVIEGAGTIGAEIAEELADIDVVISPMGSGSLASGTAIGLRGRQPGARLIAVQSAGSPAMVESYRARKVIECPARTLADSLVCRVPARLALKMLIEHVNDCWLVDDQALLAAVHTLIAWGHILVEPGAAAALAGAWHHREELKGKRIVLLATGANAGPDVLALALASPPLFDVSAFELQTLRG
jgi:threonine dehydratase